MKDRITLGEKYGPAMEVKTVDDASTYFEECIIHTMRMLPCSRADAERIERDNICYYAGYCDDETCRRVQDLFKAAHPIFGAL